jgi:hypothetical protein
MLCLKSTLIAVVDIVDDNEERQIRYAGFLRKQA